MVTATVDEVVEEVALVDEVVLFVVRTVGAPGVPLAEAPIVAETDVDERPDALVVEHAVRTTARSRLGQRRAVTRQRLRRVDTQPVEAGRRSETRAGFDLTSTTWDQASSRSCATRSRVSSPRCRVDATCMCTVEG
jgi:hypothetical protein